MGSTTQQLRRKWVAAILVAQCLWVLIDLRGQTRYFSWAPMQSVTTYRLETVLNGRTLPMADACSRYRLNIANLCGVNTHSPRQLLNTIQAYEERERLERNTRAAVHVVYRVNGGKEEDWRWP